MDSNPMELLVLNANTSAAMSAALGVRARQVARTGTRITVTQPAWGPESVEGWYDAQLSAAGMLDRMATWPDPLDGLVIAGFGDVGREALRELLSVPVLDITEAAVMAAQLVGHRYGIITTVARARPLIEANLGAAGQLSRCATIRVLGIPVASVADDWEVVARRFREEAAAAVAAGADVVCLGSAALAPFAERLGALVEVPVVDGVAAAISFCEVCHHLGLRTSQIGAWAPPGDKPRPGWPVSPSGVPPLGE
jgi:allantoin racemase